MPVRTLSDCIKGSISYVNLIDHLFNEIEENVSTQSIDDMLDALSLGIKAIQQSRQRFKQFVWLGSFGDQLVKCLARVCLVSLIAYTGE